jgi:hypothetical protein
VTDLGARFPGKLSYHSSCHLCDRVNSQPRALLAEVRRAELVGCLTPPGTRIRRRVSVGTEISRRCWNASRQY